MPLFRSFYFFLFFSFMLFGEETTLPSLNEEIRAAREYLRTLYMEGLQGEGIPSQDLLSDVNSQRQLLADKEETWRKHVRQEGAPGALWDHEETTLSHLIIEYGSSDYLYLFPPEIASMKINIHTTLPIARESWSNLIETILSHHGVGIKPLNSYARQLYLVKGEGGHLIDHVITSEETLQLLPSHARVAYLFSPPVDRMKSLLQFFDRFRDPKHTQIHQCHHQILLLASKADIQKLMSLYHTVWQEDPNKVIRVIPLNRFLSEDMESIVRSYFAESTCKGRHSSQKGDLEDPIFLSLAQEEALIVIGTKKIVEQVERLVRETEDQLPNPSEMTLFWYTCRHSDPLDVAAVLEKVYTSLLYSDIALHEPPKEEESTPPSPSYGPPPYSSVVHPPVALAATIASQKQKSETTHFIP
ncbi:MAG: hypothetical protein VXZ72_02525, partial [Chlamydiota bacterium]|nr:hypothetical protein [Chlamydiota bacterium]